jgi:hypothetical protein
MKRTNLLLSIMILIVFSSTAFASVEVTCFDELFDSKHPKELLYPTMS